MLVSIIIPCRNEEKFIARCLDSVIVNDWPKENLEVLIVDGMSDDKTKEIVNDYIKKYSFIRLLDNPQKYTPHALNIGIKNSKGDIIIRMDSHATYQKSYISKCVGYMEEYNADNIGGITKTLPAENTISAKAIAVSLSHFFGTGGAKFRSGSSKIKEVDTVFGGCYKKKVFEKIGLFNENFIRTQDLEFNLRLKKNRGRIILHPEIISYYYPKSNLKDFWIHNFKDGIWSIYPLKFSQMPLCLRHYFPLFFISGLILLWFLALFSYFFYQLFSSAIALYFLLSFLFSFFISIRKKDIRFLLVMPVTFAVRHFAYGFGSLWGLIKLLG